MAGGWLTPKPKVTVIGTFHRATGQLARLLSELEATGCRILAPLSLNFDEPDAPFVRLESEQRLSVAETEKFHLRAIAESDFLWLHAPEGYIGLSAAFELGFSVAQGKPVYCKQPPADETLRQFVKPMPSVFESLVEARSSQ